MRRNKRRRKNHISDLDEINTQQKTISILQYNAVVKIIYGNNKYCNLTITDELSYKDIIKKINLFKNETTVILHKNNTNECSVYSNLR